MTTRQASLFTPGADFYTYIHKSFRLRLFDAANRIGSIDWTDAGAAAATQALVAHLFTDLREHAEHEQTYWHPLIARVNADAVRGIEAEHALQEHQLDELEALLSDAAAGDIEAARELYRAFNAFLGGFLLHLAEEEQGNPLLWAAYPPADLGDSLHQFHLTIPFNESLRYLETMLPAMSPQERAVLFEGFYEAPPPVKDAIAAVAARVLGPDAPALLQPIA